MATYPLTFPSVGVRNSNFGITRIVGKSTSIFTGAQQVYLHPGALWRGSVEFKPMTYAESAPVRSFLVNLNGSFGTFLYGDPDYLAKGPLKTPVTTTASTNRILNGQATGAVVSGSLPTNWAVESAAGLTTTVMATGTTNGIGWVRLRVQGTASGTSYLLRYQANNTVSALIGQEWSSSAYFALNTGSLTNISAITISVAERDSGGGPLTVTGGTAAVTGLNTNLQRFTHSRALTNASVAFVRQALALTVVNGAAIDVTLDIGGVQLENLLTATPYIPTSGATVSRPAGITVDGASQTGATLLTQGFTRNEVNAVRAGDYLQLGTGTSSRLHKIVADANSNELGEVLIEIEPPLRSSPANADSVTIPNARGAFRLVDNAVNWAGDFSSVQSISFEFVEALTV